MRKGICILISALSALAALALPIRSEAQSALVCVIDPPAGDTGVTFYAKYEDTEGHIAKSEVRQHMAVLLGLPTSSSKKVIFYWQRNEIHVLSKSPTLGTEWIGPFPVSMQVSAATDPAGIDRTMHLRLTCAADPPVQRSLKDLAERLSDTETMAQDAYPEWSDSIYWSMQYLAREYAKLDFQRVRKKGDLHLGYVGTDEASRMIVASYNRMLDGERTRKLFDNRDSLQRFSLIGQLLRAQQGVKVEISQTDALSVFNDPKAFVNARASALSVGADAGYLEDKEVQSRIAREAQDPYSPLVYAANYACARSTSRFLQSLVRQGIEKGEGERFGAALRAASRVKVEGADKAVQSRVNELGAKPSLDPSDLAIAAHTFTYLNAQRTKENQAALGALLEAKNPLIWGMASRSLDNIPDASRDQAITTKLNDFKSKRAADHLNRGTGFFIRIPDDQRTGRPGGGP